MKENFYGAFQQTVVDNEIARHVEDISIKGFTIIRNLFSLEELFVWRRKIDDAYEKQEREYGRDALAEIQELDVCRALPLYDFDFINLAAHPRVLSVVSKILGEWFILNLQNAIINRPGTDHHQSSWHRDLPYQNYVITRPLAINALFAIDEFSPETGGTHVVPFTHKTEVLPSDAYIEGNRIVASAPAGSAIVFDSMLFHRAGSNRSKIIRRAVNHLYTTPILKQQYDFPRSLGNRPMDPVIARLLGYTSQVPMDDKVWRQARAEKLRTT
ncbi:phytanoyl-CoA dioxygenase family protein [Azonexus sp. IMCC34842]|uniref:phytanoyl-CoA dioxygenase family protein n=1 Tax=Azonexus sp. IMCC34842 TaxID=3420950 RepID=UPI003D100E24